MRPLSYTLFIGKELHYLEQVDSTNNYLKHLIEKNGKQQEGFLVATRHQTHGRGQSGNTWLSDAGKNIMVSVLFYPQFLEPRQIFYFNKAVALAVRECTASIINNIDPAPAVTIKWPNDIMISEKKVAGILIENSLRNNGIEYSIAGIGINLNQDFKTETGFNAISLMDVINREVDIVESINLLCGLLEKYYLVLKSFDFKKIEDMYHAYLFGVNTERKFILDNTHIRAVIKGVNTKGQLMIETEGRIREFNSKEIIYVWG
ncbi:MAG: biotin--[acetyl-CoA-carboxylase] ligase [Chitinophagales bacterium]